MKRHVFDPVELGALAAARLTAIGHAPYLASALTAMTFVRQPGLDTVAVDQRVRVYVDPDVFDRWTTAELAGVLLHEANHVVRSHHQRQAHSGIPPTLFNIASDLEINDDLLRAGTPLPEGALEPAMFDLPSHQLAEWYSAKLPEPIDDRHHLGCGSGAGGIVGDFELGDNPDIPGLDPAQVELIRDTVARSVIARGSGVPGGLERWARARLRSTTPWPTILTAAVRRALPHGVGHQRHSWGRPRRHNPTNALLPALRDTPIHVAVIIDSSGSMTQHHLDQAVSDIVVLRSIPGIARLTLVSCDTQSVEIDIPRSGAPVALVGGGGTTLGAGLEHVAKLRHRADLVIAITDGHTDWPKAAPTALAPLIVLTTPGAPPGPHWAATVIRPLDIEPR